MTPAQIAELLTLYCHVLYPQARCLTRVRTWPRRTVVVSRVVPLGGGQYTYRTGVTT